LQQPHFTLSSAHSNLIISLFFLLLVVSVSLKLMALCVRGARNPETIAFIANAPNNKSNWRGNGLLQNKVKYTGTEDIKGRRTRAKDQNTN